MSVRAGANSTAKPEPEPDVAETDTIPAIISHLKTAFLPAEFQRAERVILARESNLKREIENLKKENSKLLETNQFQKLEMLRVETDSKDVIFEQMKRISDLEKVKLKLEALVRSEYEGWKGLISKMEGNVKTLSGEKSVSLGNVENCGRGNVGVVVKVECEELGGNAIGGVALIAASSVGSEGHGGGLRVSGIQKFSSDNAGLIDRHNECAPMKTETLCENSEIHEDTESLGLTGVERELRVRKRKPESSLSASDDENRDGKFKKDKNSNSEMKQCQKLSLEPDGPPINQFIEILDSGSTVSENQKLPGPKQVNTELFLNTVMEVSSDSDNDHGNDTGSSCSSSSSDSEDESLLLSQLDDILPKAKE